MKSGRTTKSSQSGKWQITSIVAAAALAAVAWISSASWMNTPIAVAQEPKRMPQHQKHAHTNHLANETSPYLLQHAHNPVNWYPWGKEAFARAKRENKPVFLSVGYSTCYWCHVMEVESFEDNDVAAVLNKHYVAIKVDREERPDIDEQYMYATQLVNRRGGWPNSVFLTPDGKPWMAGTYFPKNQFIDMLEQLADVWQQRRDDVNKQADAFANAVRQLTETGGLERVALTPALLEQATTQLIGTFDPTHGGFGDAPKFPPHGPLQLLLRQYGLSKQEALLKPISKTLDAMWYGGIHDHIGGGFHRYSTDTEWLLPHFEKMLYDNAQLMRAYTTAWQITGHDRYRAAVADIADWVEREMTSPKGAFYSALDSGEVGKEGEGYVWPMDRLDQILDADDAAMFAKIYNFKAEGNYNEESTGEISGRNIPHLTHSTGASADPNTPSNDEQSKRLAQIRTILLAERLTWPQPHKDDKVLTSWNGLMIGSLAYAGRVLDDPTYTRAASRAADFVLQNMVLEDTLLRTFRDGKAKLPGFLDDYVFFTQGLLELHLATGDARWLEQADRFAGKLLDNFSDTQNGGFFYTSPAHEDLLTRSKHLGGGGNMPNANGVAAQLLIQLAELTDNAAYIAAARRSLESLSGYMAAQPHGSEDLLIATSMYQADATPLTARKDSAPATVATNRDGQTSQRIAPVTILARIASPYVRQGDKIKVEVVLDIDEGWHLYGDNPDADFLIPTTVSLVPGDLFAVRATEKPTATSKRDPILKREVRTYSGRLKFIIMVEVNRNAPTGAADLDLEVSTQACDSERCKQPQVMTLRVPLQIAAGTTGPRHEPGE